MKNLSIGIDTGGTYTDAVIVDTEHHKVIASAKAVTTHQDLAVGVTTALQHVLDETPDVASADISQVSLSTTLATNALVEGQGSSVTVVLIGFDDDMIRRTKIAAAIPDAKILSIGGGHKYDGHEQATFDKEHLTSLLEKNAGSADAYAIAGHYAVRNQNHERQAEQIVREITGRPVSSSCDLSDSLNGPLRALTAAFNARIISLIVNLKDAIARSMQDLNINAPIMIVKGDGSIAEAESVLQHPIETILSGPAASVIGARYLTGLSDFVIADIGGTTSDVATVIDGWPGLNDRGANVGGYHTLVKAIDMSTMGLGGDSEATISTQGEICLHAHRVVPVSMLAAKFPFVLHQLKAKLTDSGGMRSALHYLVPSADFTDAHIKQIISPRELAFLQTLHADKPTLLQDAVTGAADRSCVKKLVERGIIRRSGFTPSDAAHVLRLQNQWCHESAMLACELLGRAGGVISGREPVEMIKTLARGVLSGVVEKSAHLIIDQLAGCEISSDNELINAATHRSGMLGKLNVSVSSSLPLVAVGGPAHVIYPEVGQQLGVTATIPKNHKVANAVGAAVGLIRAERTIEITLRDSGGFRIHHEGAPLFADSGTDAIEKASELAQAAVIADLQQKGGKLSDVEIHIDRIVIPDTDEDTGLISARVTARSDSLPKKSAD